MPMKDKLLIFLSASTKNMNYLKCLEKESESKCGSDDCFVCLFFFFCHCSGRANHDLLSLYTATTCSHFMYGCNSAMKRMTREIFIDAIYFSTISEF